MENLTSKGQIALKGLFIKNAAGEIAIRTMGFDATGAISATGSQSPRSLETLICGAIGLNSEGKPALRLDTRPYKVFSALVSQSGTGAPTAVILENGLGEVPTLTRLSAGTYSLTTVEDVFTSGKTAVSVGISSPNSGVSINVSIDDEANTTITTSNALAQIDDVLASTFLEIRVYG